MAPGITQVKPNEVKQFVHENPRKLGVSAIEHDAAFAEEGTGVDRSAAVPQATRALEANRRPAESGKAAGDGPDRAGEGRARQLVTNL